MLDDDRVFQPGRKLTIAIGASEQSSEVEAFRRQHGRFVMKLQGIDTISNAEQIIGAELRIRSSELPAAQEGSFYTFHLKGCRVFTPNGECLGVVTGILDTGGTPILRVESGSQETLIPFAQSYLKKIDVGQGRIEVVLPEGLRELNR